MDEDLGRYREAWKEFSRCGELARALLSRVEGPLELSALAQADERIGTAAQELGFFTESLRAFDEGQSVVDKLLAAEPRNPKFHRFRAVVDHYRSNLYYSDSSPDLGDPARALESAMRYLNRAQEMVVGDPDDTSAQFSLAVAMFQVSFCQREYNADAAAVMARNSIRIFDGLIASGKTSYLVTSRRLRAMLRLGEAELKAGRVKEALRTAESALAGERPFAGRNAAESDEHVVLVSALRLAGQSNAANGNFDRAESLFREAREEAQLIAKDHQLQNAIPLANTETALGAFYARRHRTQEARICYEHLVELWKNFPEQNAYLDRQRTIADRLLASLHN
jgi:tetratricopeptide (TPR) repeat protein